MKAQDRLSKGGRPQKSDNQRQDVTGYQEMGIEKMESLRWQRIAEMLLHHFEGF
jgi:hypothetical protein